MTEAEAKTKWCPFMQIGLTDVRFATNRGHVLQQNEKTTLKCIGSECMAWRWTNSPERIKEHELLNKKGVGQPGRENKPWPEGQPAGYCGLAGKP